MLIIVPTNPVSLMKNVYREVFPLVHEELSYWRSRAENIPNDELRTQALASIQSKTFHCEGGAILALLAGEHIKECIKFIVAYQTISDYLDNLCDRSTSLDPKDFARLHESMPHALIPNHKTINYYQYREDQNDGDYLKDLVKTCQQVLAQVKHYDKIADYLLELANYYCDLQIHKHVRVEERVPRLERWYEQYQNNLPDMEWYEFSACSGSTLGIFCLIAYAFHDEFNTEMAEKIRNGYFPYIQGLHILLDYFIDQEEDKIGGDLNFCFYYPHERQLVDRLKHFVLEADKHTSGLPNEKFHRLINRGLLGLYLSDNKVHQQRDVLRSAKKIIRLGGFTSFFFYINGRAYRNFPRKRKDRDI